MAEDFLLVINTEVISWQKPFDLGAILPDYPGGSSRISEDPYEEDFVYRPPREQRGEVPEKEVTFLIDDDSGQINGLRSFLVYGDSQSSCLIYVQKSGSALTQDWDRLGQWFDKEVYPKVTGLFGSPLDLDGNGKIILLFFKFADSSLAGYFSESDLFDRDWESASNQGEILYMNLTAGNPESQLIRETIPHELQHLINRSRRITRQKKSSQLWIDEGLAEMAAYEVLGYPSPYHISLWNDRDGGFWDGVSLFHWDGSLEDYALSFLFFLYLKERFPGVELNRRIINHPGGNGRSILEILQEEGVPLENFGDLLQDFYLAMLLHPEDFGSDGTDLKLRPRNPSPQYDGLLPPGAAVYLPLELAPYLNHLPEHIRVIDSRDYRIFTAVP